MSKMSSDTLHIKSRFGDYSVSFAAPFSGVASQGSYYLIDRRVAELYWDPLGEISGEGRTLLIDAGEESKSLSRLEDYCRFFVERGIRRNDCLTVIGGGTLGDIGGFLASILLRGISWVFYPTTLIAQADSCVGGKTGLNLDRFKNQIGTFYPPKKVGIATELLETLEKKDFDSGLGEIFKAHLIGRPTALADLARKGNLKKWIWDSLAVKKEIVELDETERDKRIFLNYGHTFGHAIETATGYRVPHGIAVAIGMDMANAVAAQKGWMPETLRQTLSLLLKGLYAPHTQSPFSEDLFFAALKKDKKNEGETLRLVVLPEPGRVRIETIGVDFAFQEFCCQFTREVFQ